MSVAIEVVELDVARLADPVDAAHALFEADEDHGMS